jgi:hypothetical protein
LITFHDNVASDLDANYEGSEGTDQVTLHKDGQNISITPNPFYDALTIECDIKGDMDISIHDTFGRLLYHTNLESNNGSVNIRPALHFGAYIITIQTEAFIEQLKVIKR